VVETFGTNIFSLSYRQDSSPLRNSAEPSDNASSPASIPRLNSLIVAYKLRITPSGIKVFMRHSKAPAHILL